MALVNAATVIAALGDLTRFANPRQLMAYLGLAPSEHSSGDRRRQGGIAKAGNPNNNDHPTLFRSNYGLLSEDAIDP